MNFKEISMMTEAQAQEYLEQIRWPSEKACPHCGSMNVVKLDNGRLRITEEAGRAV